MFINKLHLRAFGKFAYKKLYLENKLNIIYGENEAGKSTIHNFIESVLYGFDEDEEGQAKYNKYKPWSSNIYKGTIAMRDLRGDKFLISKDFLLGTTEVFKKLNDESEIHEDEIKSPGEHFFNMSKISYSNTVSVRQLGNKTETELVDELKNKIINLSKTRDESISIDRILQRLNNIKDEAGDENNDKTLLGQYSIRLSDLKGARENSLNANRQVMFLVMEKKKVSGKIQLLNLRIEELNKELLEYELSIEKDKFLKAEPIQKELIKIDEMLKDFSDDNIQKYSDSDYRDATNIEVSLNAMYSQRRNLQNDLEKKDEELSNMLSDISNKITEQFNIAKLNNDYEKYINNITKINELKIKINLGRQSIININIDEINNFLNSYRTIEQIDRKVEITNVFLDNKNYEDMKRFKSSRTGNVVLLLLFAATLIGGVWWSSFQYNVIIKDFIDQIYVMQESVNITAGIATGLIILITGIILKPLMNKIKSAKNEIDSMECEYADNTISLDKLNKERQEIISLTDCQSFDDIVEKFSKLSIEKSMYEEKSKLINYDEDSLNTLENENDELQDNILKILSVLDMQEISAENIKIINNAYLRKDAVKDEIINFKKHIEQIKQSILKLEKEISFEEKRMGMILSSNGMDDLESFKKIVQYNEKYTELISNRDYKDNILHKIIGDESFEVLQNKTKNVSYYEVKKLDKQEHTLCIFKLNDEKSKLTEEIDNILKEIDEIENSTRSLAEIEEEIDFYENKIKAFKRKIKVAEIAADKIVKISDSIKGDFMPLLRKSISDNFAYLTGGKYCEVVIDEDMNITVVEEDNKQRKIELDSLSGGTLDQLYLSLRVGLGNIISGNQNIPLIFDDSFVQYDSKRLRNSIEMLAKESERRQIILFTCQEREAEIAKHMNIKFNFLKL